MTYQAFAYLYDELMKDAPYDKWLALTKEQSERYGVKGKRLLDLACGTGELSVRLSQAGWSVSGVDLSEDMLAVAQEKALREKQPIEFFKQDMTSLTGFKPFDLIVIFCDSLNYLQNATDVKETFAKVYELMDEDGLFMFDVHTAYKMNELFIGQTYASNEEELSFIWQCFEGESPLTVEHDLTFFVREDERYERFDELHVQRTFLEEQYEAWLIEAGFQVEEKLYDFQTNSTEESERLFFIVRKK